MPLSPRDNVALVSLKKDDWISWADVDATPCISLSSLLHLSILSLFFFGGIHLNLMSDVYHCSPRSVAVSFGHMHHCSPRSVAVSLGLHLMPAIWSINSNKISSSSFAFLACGL